MMKPFLYSNRPLLLRKGKIDIYHHLQNISARNNSIKMEVILFASLYRAKEILIFCVHFLWKNFLSTWRDRSGVPFLPYEKGFRQQKFRGLRRCSWGPLGSTRLGSYVIVVAPTSPPLLVVDSTTFFLRSFLRAMRGHLLWVGAFLAVINDQSK